VNIILFMADQMRADCVGCMGNELIQTPYLDMLASQGTLFTRAYTPSASCVPARACLLTGMNQWHTGILGMGSGMTQIADNYAHTLPGELSKAGYHTCAVGKNHFHPQRALNGYHQTVLDESSRVIDKDFVSDYVEWYGKQTGDSAGYQDTCLTWNGWMARPYHNAETLHPTHWTADRAIEFIRKRDPNKPFFLKCSFARPHSPYDPPQVYYDMYKDADIPAPFIGTWSTCHDVRKDSFDVNAWHGKQTAESIRKSRAAYYGNISFIDHSIGRVLNTLLKAGLYHDTMIIFTSDHGDMLGDHHMWRKTYAYEGSSHIPMIIKPVRGAGCAMQKNDKVVTLFDIMPTVLDAADLAVPETCDGISMMPLVRGEKTEWRKTFISEHCMCYAPEQENIFITDGRYKLIFFPFDGSLQFFDLASDPGECFDEINNLKYCSVIKQLTDELIEEFKMRNWPVTDGVRLFAKPKGLVMKSPHVGKYGVK